MATPEVEALYKAVIEEVIHNVRNDFVNMGIDEQVLIDLREIWEGKLVESKVFSTEHEGASHGQNMYFNEFDSNYDSHSFMSNYYSRNIVPAASLPTMGTNAGHSNQGRPSNPTDNYDSMMGRPRPFITPRTTFQQFQGDNPPQNDGACDSLDLKTTKDVDNFIAEKLKRIPQLDGDEDDEDEFQTELVLNVPEAQSEDENLGSELDDEEEEEDFDQSEDPRHENVILCQYEKVTRAKNKWKCTLKDGIVHVNRLDYVFHKASGDFEW